VTRLVGGRYAIERRIGEGGMAEVLLARDEARSGAPVVVKRCRAHLAHQPEFANLFLREARLASLIHHPNVVELEATGDDDGQPYLVMEYLQGFTVREIFLRSQKDGGVPQDIVAFIVLGAARGLHAAHTAVDERGVPMGLMHRDVSPHNLFVTESGDIKVLDFGIAKGVNELTMTRAGHVKGKASYLAPEQLDPNAKIDARADLFSLGIVSWELFTGKRLFRRATETDTINAIRALRVDKPNQVKPEIDQEYSDIIMRLLARKPEKRPASAQEIVEALEKALARRAPEVDSAAVAKFIATVKEIDPKEISRVSLPPGQQPARPQVTNPKVPAGAIPRAAGKPPEKPKEREEFTSTVGPPAAASWMNLGGTPAPVDGSVVGTFAVAGATGPANPDVSDAYEALDPDDVLLEPSNAGPLPQQDPDPDGDAPTQAQMPAVVPPTPQPMAGAITAPPPRRMSPFHAETVRIRRSQLDALVVKFDRQVYRLISIVEGKIGTRPPPAIIAGVLAGALLLGVLISFLITSIFQ
jgi:serine/threonine protein kinase